MQKGIEFFRQEYKKQKKLEQIVNSRTLNRPKVKKWQVATIFVTLPFLLFACIYFILINEQEILPKIILVIISIVFVAETHLRLCLIFTVKCYQRYAKVETRRRCKCIPSCSEYAIIALKKIFPIALAIKKIKKRLYVTCNGEEYKIDFPTKKGNRKFESKL